MAKASRLYPPVPHIGLNISQNLAHDLGQFFESPQHHLLPELLRKPASDTTIRVLTALTWYNRANALASSNDSTIIDLAVAFETLLALRRGSKTEGFVDAVSLLLGRLARLDLWAKQFYEARSDVAHEGRTERLHFLPMKHKNTMDSNRYQPLLAYGRQIFQLCVGTLLFGAHLGERSGLREKFVTNQERFEFICKTLNDENLAVADRFAAIEEPVVLIREFRFVAESALLMETLIGAVQGAAKSLLLCDDLLDPIFKQRVENLARVQRSNDPYEALDALQALNDLKGTEPEDPRSPQAITQRLVEVVWDYTFMHYFWIKEQRNKGQPAG